MGIVICNFNKKDYVLSCIESIFKSTYKDVEIYVVDNASTDGSVEYIREKFGERVNLLINETNLGGSGGFNRGLQEALKKEHQYLLLLDNDVRLEVNAISRLVDVMDEDNSIAVAGAAIYKMDDPKRVQEIGSVIDWNRLTIKLLYKNLIEPKELPEIIECDYVPACCALVRVDAISRVGLIDDRLFIYWDDVEWCYRFKLKGYKVIALPTAVAWHKGGAGVSSTTFPQYYFMRNRVHFFTKYLPAEKLEELAEMMITTWFNVNFFGGAKGIHSVARTVIMAFEDAMNGVYGKASENRIFYLETARKDLLQDCFNNCKRLFIVSDQQTEITNVQKYIEPLNIDTTVIRINAENNINQTLSQLKSICDKDTIIIYCPHQILETPDEVSDVLVVDDFLNVVDLRQDPQKIFILKELLNHLIATYLPLYVSRLQTLRQIHQNENQLMNV